MTRRFPRLTWEGTSQRLNRENQALRQRVASLEQRLGKDYAVGYKVGAAEERAKVRRLSTEEVREAAVEALRGVARTVRNTADMNSRKLSSRNLSATEFEVRSRLAVSHNMIADMLEERARTAEQGAVHAEER